MSTVRSIRPTACLLATACALLLAACGGGGDGGSTASTGGSGAAGEETAPSSAKLKEALQAPKQAPPKEAAPAKPGAASEEDATPQSEQSEREAYERKRYGSPSKQSAPFAKYSGRASEGKMHVAEFGDEASGSDRAGVQATLTGYLQALGEDDLTKACAYLSGGMNSEVLNFASQSDQTQGKSCEEGLGLAREIFSKGGNAPYDGAVAVTSLRVERGGPAGEGAGFALFHGDDGTDYWIVVRREGGDWKVGSVAPQSFR